ncbi:CoA ester lyase [Streptomyces tubbatahanensis]|uniref:CoA ester lyase n=1 Tax=Streptomyces tubbatahanensis TaxID=2923272 RepID=A0ABY3Y1G8_9ACTN|nr:CoA ester lyase [Streptomyces tubbatahanensis]UNT00680.1 CoA ester lyase [Streptomyces tubbatahanensis]
MSGTKRAAAADGAAAARSAPAVPLAVRSWLYVPATRPDLLPKAMSGEADAVVLDLEDAVPAGRKDEARDHALKALEASWPKPLWVRVNQAGSAWGDADLAALATAPVQGIRLPKCESAQTVRDTAAQVDADLHLLLETALGVEHAYALATAAPQVAYLSLGEADLRADLRARRDTALDWARGRVVNAARAAGLAEPVQSVWTAVDDLPGLTLSTEEARDSGFFGRSVVHPRQIAPVNAAFTPTAREAEEARRLVHSLRQVEDAGSAAWLDAQGRLVDPAVVAQARWVLDRLHD